MFKKVLIGFFALILLLVGAGFLFFKVFVGPSNPANFLPADTVFYAALPDLIQTASRWNKTSLAKISKEPDVKKFLEKPVGKVIGSPKKEGASAGKVLLDLKPSRFFVTAQKLSATEAQLALGIQYWGGAASFHRAVEALIATLAPNQTVTAIKETYGDFEIQIFQLPNQQLGAVSWKNWGFLANDPAALKAILDSATHPQSPKLAQDPLYISTTRPLSLKPDFLAFMRVAPVLDALLAAGEQLGASVIPQQVNAIREAQAIGFSTKLSGADLQDVLFIRTEKPISVPPPLNSKDIAFTNSKTLGFFQFAVDWDRLKPDESLAPTPGIPADALALLERLHREAREAFSNEGAIVVNWPDGAMRPQAGFVVQATDPEKATRFIEQTLASFTGQASVTREGDISIYQFAPAGGGMLRPSIALVDSYVVAALDLSDLQGILASHREDSSLVKNPLFAREAGLWKSANRGYGYMDSAQLFDRTYTAVRPVLLFARSLMPQSLAYVDFESLPENKSIVQHLNPIVYSHSSTAEGFLVESKGPITINQAAILALGLGWQFGATAAAFAR